MKFIKIKGFIKLIRPKQFFKSFFLIFGAIPAIFLMSVRFDTIIFLLATGIIYITIIQGIVYTTNDIADVKQDRTHPTKKFRPIASKLISAKEGVGFIIFLFVLMILMAYFLGYIIFLIGLAYIVNNLLYSLKPIRLKKYRYLDIISAALGFPLRVMIGWFLFEPYNQAKLSFSWELITTQQVGANIQSILFNAPSRIINLSVQFSTITISFASIMIMTYFLACFLLSLKRLAEKLSFRNAGKFRKSLRFYRTFELKIITIVSGLISIISFSLLAWSLKPVLIILVPLVVYLLYWYYKLTFEKNTPVKEPEKVFTKMPHFILLGFLFVILFILLLML